MVVERDGLRTAMRVHGRWGRWSPATKTLVVVVTVVVALGVSYLCWVVMYETVMKSQISTEPQIVHSCPAASSAHGVSELPAPSSLPNNVPRDVSGDAVLGIADGVVHRDLGW